MTIIPRWFARFRPCSIATGLRVTLGALLVEWSEKFNVFAVRAEELIEKNRLELVCGNPDGGICWAGGRHRNSASSLRPFQRGLAGNDVEGVESLGDSGWCVIRRRPRGRN
jgi:hypothetical protein